METVHKLRADYEQITNRKTKKIMKVNRTKWAILLNGQETGSFVGPYRIYVCAVCINYTWVIWNTDIDRY